MNIRLLCECEFDCRTFTYKHVLFLCDLCYSLFQESLKSTLCWPPALGAGQEFWSLLTGVFLF